MGPGSENRHADVPPAVACRLHKAHFPPQVRQDATTDRDPLHSELQRAAVSVLYATVYSDRECRFDDVSHRYWARWFGYACGP